MTRTRWIVLLFVAACNGDGDGAGGIDTTTMSGGSGGSTSAMHGDGGSGPAGTGGTNAGTGGTAHGGAGHGAGGSGGVAGASGSGGAGGAGGTSGTGGAGGGGDESCPPECLRAYECAASCSDTPVNHGCCPCPAGTIDVITCPMDAGQAQGAYCGVPCSGAKPDDSVVATCQAFKTEAECTAYTGAGFPDHCAWHTPATPPCLAP